MLKAVATQSLAAAGITIGTSVITGGTDKRVLFDDNGVVGESAGLTFTKGNGGTTSTLTLGGVSSFRAPADGVLTLLDTAATSFGRIQFGGTTSSFPSIKRSSATLAFRLADDSADASVSVSTILTSGGNSTTTPAIGASTSTGLGLTTSDINFIVSGSRIALLWSGGFQSTTMTLTAATGSASAGQVQLGNTNAAASVAANFVADRRLQINVAGVTWYLAASTTAW